MSERGRASAATTAGPGIDGPNAFTIVGLGASAGGLEALEQFFAAAPADGDIAYVVIQHLSPDFKSHMAELLGRQTRLAVQTASDNELVRPNSIYLIPPRMEMVVRHGRLLLSKRSADRGQIHPIDQFFQSLAEDVGARAVAVVLSGTGSDGSRGIIHVQDAGGLVLVQDEASSKFDGMPRSAIETGKADLILPPAAIADAIVRYVHEGVSKEQLTKEVLAHGDMKAVDQVTLLLDRKHGIDFSHYKSGTVGRRISRRVEMSKVGSVENYVSRLTEDEHELNELYKDLLIGVTKFFRDAEAFESLRTKVILPLIRDADSKSIRIWVSACASGEEAYTVAMLVDEILRDQSSNVDVKIFATDAHEGSLQVAAKGLYPSETLDEISEHRRERYFRRTADGYQVTRQLRNYIVFATQNILNDAPFTQMDLVTCRNMLIYLQPAAQRKALTMFHFALKPKGTLFLGSSETVGELSDEFKAIDGRWRLYTKTRDVRLDLTNKAPLGRRAQRLPHVSTVSVPPRSNRVDADTIATYDQLLAQTMGCSILVSESGEVLHIFGGAEKYLIPRGGRPSNQILEMLETSLRSTISIALHHALANGRTIRQTSNVFSDTEHATSVYLTIKPLRQGDTGPNNVLISFDGTDVAIAVAEDENPTISEMHRSRVGSLENELRDSQENLQTVLEEMETSNEELQASNEELIASNEELQSTNEELHSVNEELYTVNAEHQRRVEELAQANDDMDNLLATTQVGVIFLDRDLYIRRFTPEIARVFEMTDRDAGRSIEHFAEVLNHPKLAEKIRDVGSTHQTLELKVSDKRGTTYLLRALPYQSSDKTTGIVLTLIDISSLEDAEAEIRLQKMAIESAINGIVITDPRQHGNPIVYANQGFLDLTGFDREEVIGRNCRFLQCDETDPKKVQRLRNAIENEQTIRVTLLNHRKNGDRFWNDLSVTPLRDASGNVVNFVGVQHNVTADVDARQALQRANEVTRRASQAKSSFLATMSHELRTPLTAMLGFADILASESNEPSYLEKVDTIRRNGKYLLALLNDILDLSKIEAGKLQFGHESIDIRTVMKEVDILMQVRANESKVPLEFDLQKPLPASVTADEVRVRQIIVNLVGNAIKFADSGKVVVTASMNEDIDPKRLEISVIDTGIGISAQHLERLFTPFNQASKQTTRHAGGTGLGLSISKRLAEGMGGTIEVKSQLGEGSTFTLCMPVTSEQARHLIEEPSATQLKGPPNNPPSNFPRLDVNILLADDRRDIWQVGKHFLEKCGARVTIADNGQRAVEEVELAYRKNDPFALVLMDMQMPVMNGREAVGRLRELGYNMPIIALTADAMDGERDACIEMGCNEYFPKPIDGLKLTNLIASLLERGQANGFASAKNPH